MEKTTEPKDNQQFRPLTEGLGLNHFADGLPYTPSNSFRKPAVQFQFPQPRTARKEAVEAPRVEISTELYEEIEAEPIPAKFIARILAYVIDVSVSSSIFAFIVWGSFALNGFDLKAMILQPPKSVDRIQILFPLFLLYMVVYMGYFLILETTWRTSIGKMMLGLRIRTTSGFAALGRALCFFISVVPFGIGLFWYFFDSKNRCWHDVITETEVVHS